MTEAEWWGATDPERLIDWLFFDALAADRKLRLFCVACCWRVSHWIQRQPISELLRATEDFADGRMSEVEMLAVYDRTLAWYHPQPIPHPRESGHADWAVLSAAGACSPKFLPRNPDGGWSIPRDRAWYEERRDITFAHSTAWEASRAVAVPYDGRTRDTAEGQHQVHLLHDVFGPLPFRDVPVDPQWLTADVVALARGIYDGKAFDRVPVLADALQDAGCTNDELLRHCRREEWEHARGCWVVDLLLGRPWREGPGERMAPGG